MPLLPRRRRRKGGGDVNCYLVCYPFGGLVPSVLCELPWLSVSINRASGDWVPRDSGGQFVRRVEEVGLAHPSLLARRSP